MPTLEIKNLKKEFALASGGRLILFDDLSLKFEENEEFLTILAPFGSGKTTLLQIIAGLEEKTTGEILLNGNNYSKPDARIVYIPEKSSSFPWLSVLDNITAPIKQVNKSHIEKILRLIGLEAYSDHLPDQASIGFRFRIAIGRALAISPAFILIDDSLKLLDSITRTELYEMLRKIVSETGTKVLSATTNVTEAVSLADRIILMKKKPAMIAGEYKVDEKRDKHRLIEFINNTLPQDNQKESINFTI